MKDIENGNSGATLDLALIGHALTVQRVEAPHGPAESSANGSSGSNESDHVAVRRILRRLGLDEVVPYTPSDRIDRVVLHPVIGPMLLALILFLVFQAVFAWAEVPMSLIEAARSVSFATRTTTRCSWR